MAPIRVNIKWSGKKYDNVELDPSESASLFKSQVYTLTGVEPERQKIFVKGGVLKDDADLSKLGIKEGQTLMMMGTAGEAIPKAPEKPVVFLEDMSDEQVAQALQLPAGLQNLGNTCYMNATLQCLRMMPELKVNLNSYQGGLGGVDGRGNLTASLRDLLNQLDKISQGFPPVIFWQMLQQAFPQFAQRGAGGVPMQQDAEECWSQLIQVLKAKLPDASASTAAVEAISASSADVGHQNFVQRYMSGTFVNTQKCIEAPEEPATVDYEQFSKLDCHISISTNYMQNGILDTLKQTLEKNSDTLGRTAQYEKISKISRLPTYLTVHFIRFFWKANEGVRAKIMRKVKFPLEYDATELCTPELQAKMSKVKQKYIEVTKEREEKERLAKKAKNDEQAQASNTESSGMQVDEPTSVAKVNWDEYIDPDLKQDVGANVTGLYELCAVLTHVGRSADSGHYIGWTKKANNEWYKYDDDKVSMVTNEDILKLDGGGDWHTAYICLYRAKKLE